MTDRDEIDDIIEDAIAAEKDRQDDGIHGPDWHEYSRAIRNALRAAGMEEVPRQSLVDLRDEIEQSPPELIRPALQKAQWVRQIDAMFASHTAREGFADTAPDGEGEG